MNINNEQKLNIVRGNEQSRRSSESKFEKATHLANFPREAHIFSRQSCVLYRLLFILNQNGARIKIHKHGEYLTGR